MCAVTHNLEKPKLTSNTPNKSRRTCVSYFLRIKPPEEINRELVLAARCAKHKNPEQNGKGKEGRKARKGYEVEEGRQGDERWAHFSVAYSYSFSKLVPPLGV